MTFLDLQLTHPPENLTISNLEVHVWIAWLDDWVERLLPFLGILEKRERHQGARFRFERDRKRFLTKRFILKKLLSLYLDTAPQMIRLRHNHHGKPYLISPSGDNSLQFSSSHSQGLALYVFTRQRHLGVDLESLQSIPEIDALLSRWFPHPEATILQSLATREKHLAFYRLWTQKEAYLKALGQGLGGPQHIVDFFPQGLGQYPGEELTRLGPWTLQVLTPAPHFISALAVEGDDYRLRSFEWGVETDFHRCGEFI
jgi:4'-phosphopantetheinyl transferase